MNFKFADIGDTDRLLKLRFDYFAAENFEYSPGMGKQMQSQLEEYFPKHINQDFFAALAEDESGEVRAVAFLVIFEKPANSRSFPTGRSGLILNVLTYPQHRRQGYATKLLNLLIGEAKARKLSYIELSASEMGMPMYEKLGFKLPEPSHFTDMKLNLL